MKKLILTILLFLIPSISHADIWSGLIAWYRMDDAASGVCVATNTIVDSSGNGKVATCSGSLTWQPPRIGLASLNFSAGTGTLTGPASSYFIPSSNSPTSIAFWVNASSIGAGALVNRLVDILATSSTSTLIISLGSTNVLSFFNSGTTVNWTNTISLNKWYHVVLTYDGTNYTKYLNGVQDGTQTTSTLAAGTAGTNAQFGNLNSIDGFLGNMDDLRFYNRGLTSNDVAQLYQYGLVTIQNASLRNFNLK